MKFRHIGYWFATGALAFVFAMGGFMDATHAPPVVATMEALGYPPYVATILGVWKPLGAVALLAPRLPRLKEWAYAGIVFNLTGAAFSHASAGDSPDKIVIPLVLLAVAFASWALRPESRRLASAAAHASSREERSVPASGQRLAA
jgi:uncharacterized membrane protein YphA (DoxX/SURF4 family)